MKEHILNGLVKQIKEDIGIRVPTSHDSIFDIDINIVGSENNPHLLTEEGLLFNKFGEPITSFDLRLLIYSGVEKDEKYSNGFKKRTNKEANGK